MSTYARSAQYYDSIQSASGRNYALEASYIHETLRGHNVAEGGALLDAGCGTGRHLEHLRARYDCEGLDVDRAMLAQAQSKMPDLRFTSHDMIGFNLDRHFDAIMVIAAIGYVPNARLLEQTLETFARHLKPGGVVLVEPWYHPEQWHDGEVNARFVDQPKQKVARMSVSRRDGNASILHYNYMVAGTDGVRTFNEPHRLMLFTDDEYRRAFARARLAAEYDDVGVRGRGLYVGTRF